MKTVLPAGMIAIVALLAGCGPEPVYHVVAKNPTSTELSAVTVRFGNFRFNFGALEAGIFASHMFTNEREPLPETVELSWTASDGQTVVQKLPVKSVAPARYANLYVTFLITSPTSATVRFEDRQRR